MPDVDVEIQPRVWVGCLGCYNGGRLNGKWVDAAKTADTTEMGLSAYREDSTGYRGPFCKLCGSDEFWVMDHEGFEGFLTGECSVVEAHNLALFIQAIREDGTHPVGAVAAWRDYVGNTSIEWDAPTREAFEDSFCGTWESEQAYAENYAEEISAVNDSARWPNNHIDWPGATRELMQDFHVEDAGPAGVYLFRI